MLTVGHTKQLLKHNEIEWIICDKCVEMIMNEGKRIFADDRKIKIVTIMM